MIEIGIGFVSSGLPEADVGVVLQVAAAAQVTDGVAPLSEQTLLRLEDPNKVVLGVRHVLARDASGQLVGYAQLDDEPTAELVVAPSRRRHGVGSRLVAELQSAAGGSALKIWAHGDLPRAAALAAQTGYERARVLLQLRRSLNDPLPDPQFPVGVEVRTFRPGVDEKAWLEVNNAAFSSHPEQGRWTVHDVKQRESKDWFDPAGFFLAERNGELVGFHWTKVHAFESPPVGEVYIVGVRPQDSGQKLGPALTLLGLHHLRARGLGQVLLYVDEDNAAAVKTYERLGFTRWGADVLYTQPTSHNHL